MISKELIFFKKWIFITSCITLNNNYKVLLKVKIFVALDDFFNCGVYNFTDIIDYGFLSTFRSHLLLKIIVFTYNKNL